MDWSLPREAQDVVFHFLMFSTAWPMEDSCGQADVAPAVSELSCSGAESGPLACPHEAGDDVFCAPSGSLVVTCAGDGETQGRPAKESALQLSM